MLVLVTYDVSTIDPAGSKRLRRVAKHCERYGQRVQASVFECYIDQAQYESLKLELSKIISMQKDSLRFYRLGNKYKTKVEHIGLTKGIDMKDPIVF